MKYKINVNKSPNQEFTVNIPNGDIPSAVDFRLRSHKGEFMSIDIVIDGVPSCYSRRCVDRMPLNIDKRLNGIFYFEDIFGLEDPVYIGLNERWLLVYDMDFTLG